MTIGTTAPRRVASGPRRSHSQSPIFSLPRSLWAAPAEIFMYDSRIGSSTLFVRIMTVTPIVAVNASSRTISMSTTAITMKPSALASKAVAPGMNSRMKQLRDAVTPSAPCKVSSFQALVIWTACETPIEKIRNGTRMDNGSRPSPSRGSKPSSQITGTEAATRAATVSVAEPEYQYSNAAVMKNALTKKTRTLDAPSAMSAMDLAKPMIWMETRLPSYFVRMASSWAPILRKSSLCPVSGSRSCRVATTNVAVWSADTMRPTRSDFITFSRTSAIWSGRPAKSPGIRLPLLKPSSTTSL